MGNETEVQTKELEIRMNELEQLVKAMDCDPAFNLTEYLKHRMLQHFKELKETTFSIANSIPDTLEGLFKSSSEIV